MVSNAALRMQNGMQIQPDEQQQLLAHSRALTEALSAEMSPIAVGQSGQWDKSPPALPAKVVAFSSRELGSDGFAENPDAYRVWKPQPVREPVTPTQFREKLAALTQKLTMPKPKPRSVSQRTS